MNKRKHFQWAAAGVVILAAGSCTVAGAFDLGDLQHQLAGALGGAASKPVPQIQPPAPVDGTSRGSSASAAALAALSAGEVGQGLKAALSRGVDSAVGTLGRADGFYGSPKWRIPLPPALDKASGLMRMAGMGQQADALDLAINRAAEAAVPQAKTLLVDAVKSMSIADAKGILTGGDEAATAYFRRKTEAPLARKFMPIVKQATAQVGLAQTYDRYAGQAAQFGLVKADQANIDSYVTRQALDRLYQAIGEEERAIRTDPAGTGSALIGKVFGALRGS